MGAATLLGGLIFSGIGFIALVYGKKTARIKTAALGLILMIYPYFIYETILVYTIGIVLTLCLFIYND